MNIQAHAQRLEAYTGTYTENIVFHVYHLLQHLNIGTELQLHDRCY